MSSLFIAIRTTFRLYLTNKRWIFALNCIYFFLTLLYPFRKFRQYWSTWQKIWLSEVDSQRWSLYYQVLNSTARKKTETVNNNYLRLINDCLSIGPVKLPDQLPSAVFALEFFYYLHSTGLGVHDATRISFKLGFETSSLRAPSDCLIIIAWRDPYTSTAWAGRAGPVACHFALQTGRRRTELNVLHARLNASTVRWDSDHLRPCTTALLRLVVKWDRARRAWAACEAETRGASTESVPDGVHSASWHAVLRQRQTAMISRWDGWSPKRRCLRVLQSESSMDEVWKRDGKTVFSLAECSWSVVLVGVISQLVIWSGHIKEHTHI